MCEGTRAHHVWLDVGTTLGLRLASAKKLARAQAARLPGSTPAVDDEGETP